MHADSRDVSGCRYKPLPAPVRFVSAPSHIAAGRLRRPIERPPIFAVCVSSCPSMLRAVVKLPLLARFSRGSGHAWVHDPALAFYPGSHASARPPETVQSQSGHVSGGTSFVAVGC